MHTPVTDINALWFLSACGIDHLVESPVFVLFPAGLYDKVRKPRVGDGEKGVYMDLVKSSGGFSVWPKESVGVIRVPVNVQCRPIAGDELVLVLEKLFF